MATVRFIGLGRMGRPMAVNLVRAGYDVRVADKDPARVVSMQGQGVTAADTAAAAITEDAVVLCLPGPREVEEVGLGPAGLLNAMAPGSSLINASTVSASLMRRIDELARPRGVAVIDAPMTGGVSGAGAGSLTFMVGAEEQALDKVRPLLAAMASKILHMGPVGAGSVAKLVINMLWFVHVVALADGMAAGVRAGIEPYQLQRLIEDSAGTSAVAESDLPEVLKGELDEGFTLGLSVKDLRLAEELMHEQGVTPALVALVRQRYEEASRRFGAGSSALAPLAVNDGHRDGDGVGSRTR